MKIDKSTFRAEPEYVKSVIDAHDSRVEIYHDSTMIFAATLFLVTIVFKCPYIHEQDKVNVRFDE